ncbi:MAG TPA: cation-transporting P-type ATPase, partial [Ramlibacter sp.]|nr:cation-transporting P-type ATPase [Ramlibacter sp.]
MTGIKRAPAQSVDDAPMQPEPSNVVRAHAAPHAHGAEELIELLASTPHGLSQAEAQARLARFGRNALPRAKPPTWPGMFLRQFKSPLIYVLLAAALVSAALREWTDASFIFAVLLINAVIGAFQEYAAERSAQALGELVAAHSRVVREG